jgi:hypothetical protein
MPRDSARLLLLIGRSTGPSRIRRSAPPGAKSRNRRFRCPLRNDHELGLIAALVGRRAGQREHQTFVVLSDLIHGDDIALRLADLVSEAEGPLAAGGAGQLVHGDFWGNNVYFRGEKLVAVTDLDFMGNRPRVDDLALTLYFTDEEMQLTHAADRPAEERIATLRPLVGAYAAALSTPLSESEWQALPWRWPGSRYGDRRVDAEVTVGSAGERACPCDRRCGASSHHRGRRGQPVACGTARKHRSLSLSVDASSHQTVPQCLGFVGRSMRCYQGRR